LGEHSGARIPFSFWFGDSGRVWSFQRRRLRYQSLESILIMISLLGLRLRADPRSRGNGVFERDVPSFHFSFDSSGEDCVRQSESPWKLFRLGADN